ncbi:MAG: HDIG domain-containing protein, partial [Spirochaetales bacterium]|nr:HDIG domain-containing protein [Spirochaetales bacterium]
VIIRRGDILTEQAADQIDAMNAIAVNQFSPKRFISTLFIILSFFLFTYFFMRICRVNLFSELKNLIFLSVTILMYVIAVHIPVYTGYDTASNYFGLFIPTATFSLVFTFMYDKQTALFASIVLSIIFFVSSGYNDSGFMFVFLSGITSLFGISKITKRSDLLSLGLRISLRNVAIAVFVMLSLNLDSVQLLPFLGGAAFNGILSAILAVGFIAVGELVLNTPTVFRLQELSDMSSPLLKELLSHAGGTYSHSFTVAGIAENAANDIGANGLLAKVGALYHDTGKIDNPEYFVENQSDYNVHDDLKPSISVAILKNHVKLGVERAKAAKMPDKVIEIIAQHHGTSLIRFFYEKAKNAADSDKEEIDENMYRYPGEKPQFIESAIVMLADQVEAATRALDKPNTTNIEKRVNAIVDGNYESGQLDDSGLTLKDISKIKTSFIRILSGMHHSRIKYPDEKKSEDNQESKPDDRKPDEKSAQTGESSTQNIKNESKSSI